jgi:hypothetical protein
MSFDMGRAWNDGIARVKANFQLLAVLGGIFFFLPSVLLFVAMPDAMTAMMNPDMNAASMEQVVAGLGVGFFGLYLLIILASFIGQTAMIALMGDARRVSVGEAIGTGVKVLLPLFAILVLFVIGYFVVALAIGLVVGLVISGAAAVSAGLATALTVVLFAAMFVAVLWAMTRFSMTLPVLALEGSLNPIAALGRSWRITRPVQWRLLLFYVLLFIAYLVLALVLFMIMGVIVAAIGAPSALGFLNGVVGALVAMVFSGVVVGIYLQLAGPAAATVSETFE